MLKRLPTASLVPVLVLVLASCSFFGSRAPVQKAAAAAPQPAWYVLENGRFVAIAGGELAAARAGSFQPWTLQERVAAFARLGDAAYVAVNGYGVARIEAGGFGEAGGEAADAFTYFYDRALFRARTLRAVLPETEVLVCHVYRDSLLDAPAAPGDAAAANLLRVHPGPKGFQVDFLRPPFQASAPGWEAVGAARGKGSTYWLEWKREAAGHVEFEYTTYDPVTGEESRVSREEFRGIHGVVSLGGFSPRDGNALDLLVARLAGSAGANEYLEIAASDGSRLARHYVRVPEASGATTRRVAIFADAGRAFALTPDGVLLEARNGSAEVRSSRLPQLPQGFVYSDLLVSGTALVAAWEQVDFFRVGRAGLFVKADAF